MDILIGVLTVVTGVAGSGKSSLIHQTFLRQHACAIVIDQSPVGIPISHASYITRSSALELDKQQNRGSETYPNSDESTLRVTLDDNLDVRAIDDQEARDADGHP